MLALATTAQAVPTLYLWDGTPADNTTATSGTGAVTFNGVVGSWVVNVDTGLTKPVIGTAAKPDMDLNFVDVGSQGAPTLGIAFFDSGFTSTLAGALAHIGGTLSAGSTLTFATYTRAGNSAASFTGGALDLSTWTLLTSQSFAADPNSTTPFSGSASGGNISGGADPYSLLEVITITPPRGGSANVSGDAELQAPDGGMTAMLLGSSLTALALLRRSLKLKA